MPTCRRGRVHRPPVLQKSYPVTDARCAPLRRARSAGVRPTRCGAGGYKIRPYGHASGFPVGAAYMAARNRVLIRAVVRRFSCRRGAHGASACPRRARQSADRCGRRAACPTCRRDRVHRPPVLQKSYPVTDARCAPLRRVRSAMVCPTRRCGTGGYKIRPYRPASGFPVGAAYMAARAQLPRRMHHRRPHPVGADAHIGPLRIDIKSTVAERTHRRGAHGASGTGCDKRGPVVDVPGSGRNFCIAPADAGPYDIAAL